LENQFVLLLQKLIQRPMRKLYISIAELIKSIFSNLRMSAKKHPIVFESSEINTIEALVPVKNIRQTFNELGTSFLNNKTFVF